MAWFLELIFDHFFECFFWRFWVGSGTHFGVVLELKIDKKRIKKCVDFSMDFLMDFGTVFDMILGSFLDEKSIKNQWKSDVFFNCFLVDF